MNNHVKGFETDLLLVFFRSGDFFLYASKVITLLTGPASFRFFSVEVNLKELPSSISSTHSPAGETHPTLDSPVHSPLLECDHPYRLFFFYRVGGKKKMKADVLRVVMEVWMDGGIFETLDFEFGYQNAIRRIDYTRIYSCLGI